MVTAMLRKSGSALDVISFTVSGLDATLGVVALFGSLSASIVSAAVPSSGSAGSIVVSFETPAPAGAVTEQTPVQVQVYNIGRLATAGSATFTYECKTCGQLISASQLAGSTLGGTRVSVSASNFPVVGAFSCDGVAGLVVNVRASAFALLALTAAPGAAPTTGSLPRIATTDQRASSVVTCARDGRGASGTQSSIDGGSEPAEAASAAEQLRGAARRASNVGRRAGTEASTHSDLCDSVRAEHGSLLHAQAGALAGSAAQRGCAALRDTRSPDRLSACACAASPRAPSPFLLPLSSRARGACAAATRGAGGRAGAGGAGAPAPATRRPLTMTRCSSSLLPPQPPPPPPERAAAARPPPPPPRTRAPARPRRCRAAPPARAAAPPQRRPAEPFGNTFPHRRRPHPPQPPPATVREAVAPRAPRRETAARAPVRPRRRPRRPSCAPSCARAHPPAAAATARAAAPRGCTQRAGARPLVQRPPLGRRVARCRPPALVTREAHQRPPSSHPAAPRIVARPRTLWATQAAVAAPTAVVAAAAVPAAAAPPASALHRRQTTPRRSLPPARISP